MNKQLESSSQISVAIYQKPCQWRVKHVCTILDLPGSPPFILHPCAIPCGCCVVRWWLVYFSVTATTWGTGCVTQICRKETEPNGLLTELTKVIRLLRGRRRFHQEAPHSEFSAGTRREALTRRLTDPQTPVSLTAGSRVSRDEGVMSDYSH